MTSVHCASTLATPVVRQATGRREGLVLVLGSSLTIMGSVMIAPILPKLGAEFVGTYVLVSLAAVVRIALPLLAPEQTLVAVQCSATLWSAGFGLYAVRYWPWLTRARLDGKPG